MNEIIFNVLPTQGPSFTDLIYLLTLIVLIIYTYYTRQIANIASKGPALLEVQRDHSRILIRFLADWLEVIKPLPHYENMNIRTSIDPESVYDDFASCLARYERHNEKWEYRDFLDYHLPKEQKDFSDLEDSWNNFKATVVELRSKRDELYKSISDDIDGKLKDIEQEYGNIALGRKQYIKFLKEQVYQLCTSIQPSEKVTIFHIGNDLRIDYYTLINSNNGNIILSNGTREQMEKAKKELEIIGNQNYTIGKNADLLEMIRKIDAEMNKRRDDLQSKIDKLIGWTSIFPGTSCDRLRDFKINT